LSNFSIELILLAASSLLLLSILGSRFLGKFGIPSLLLFLAIGMLAGSEGPGGIYFDDPRLAQSLGVVALVLILFAGGLDTEWGAVRPVLWRGLVLSTLGVFITAFLAGAFVSLILGFSLLDGLLVGAIVSSTDAAAVFSVLRSKNVGLRGTLKPLLELESGSNDPMAVLLTVGFIHLLTRPDASMIDLVPRFFWQMTLGAAAGYGMGRAIVYIVNHLKLEFEGLYPVLTVSLVALTYGGVSWMGGNGFLAVYLAGLIMGNHKLIHKRSLMRFHDGLAWLMQIAMFLTLGLLVFPSRLIPVMGSSLLAAAFLIFVARPASVFISLFFTRMSLRDKTLVSWVGLRGAVPIVLATFPLLAGIPRAELIFDLVFFIVLTSVLLQGTTIPLVAKWLGVDAPIARGSQYFLDFPPACNLSSEVIELTVGRDSKVAGRQVLDVGLPGGALILLVSRVGECFIPGGGTVLEAGDQVLIMADRKDIARVHSLIESAKAAEG
jgi:cell volume regulation protein A